MSDADVVVGWNNAASFVISDGTTTGHALPAFDAVHTIAPSASPATLDASHTIKVSYTHPVAASGSDKAFPSGSVSFIYAMSNAAPATQASANSAFAQHDAGHAGFTATWVAPGGSSGGSGSAKGNGAAGSAKAAAGVLFFGLVSVLFVISYRPNLVVWWIVCWALELNQLYTNDTTQSSAIISTSIIGSSQLLAVAVEEIDPFSAEEVRDLTTPLVEDEVEEQRGCRMVVKDPQICHALRQCTSYIEADELKEDDLANFMRCRLGL
ncbi:hypothetical protein BJ742DRAFT_745677 [Cladochytrium replicatum]|nr:hypothetical protein BJ742DRAFT_745677 [Cladochytrium replicatum]